MKTLRKTYLLIPALLIFISFFTAGCGPKVDLAGKPERITDTNRPTLLVVKPGIDVLVEENLEVVAGKRVGLITNPSGVNRDLKSTIDVLYDHPHIDLTTLYGPEHGIRGDIPAGMDVEGYVDIMTGLPVFSLYGKTLKPTKGMLKNVDILLFDIQDVGVRPYTYIYTMAYAMEAARDAGIQFCVLDRPNPLGGELVEGNVLDINFKSFIGLYPIPYVHGMTAGELAWMFNTEFGIGVDLRVVPVSGWKRGMRFAETGLKWVPTSPHIPEASTAAYFATTGCMGELGTISEGVGSTQPFKLAGAPWIDPEALAGELMKKNIPGVHFRPSYWKPFYGKWQGQQLGGVQIYINDPDVYKPFETGLYIIEAVWTLYPGADIFSKERIAAFNRAAGTDTIAKLLQVNTPVQEIVRAYQRGLEEFKLIRQKYLLY